MIAAAAAQDAADAAAARAAETAAAKQRSAEERVHEAAESVDAVAVLQREGDALRAELRLLRARNSALVESADAAVGAAVHHVLDPPAPPRASARNTSGTERRTSAFSTVFGSMHSMLGAVGKRVSKRSGGGGSRSSSHSMLGAVGKRGLHKMSGFSAVYGHDVLPDFGAHGGDAAERDDSESPLGYVESPTSTSSADGGEIDSAGMDALFGDGAADDERALDSASLGATRSGSAIVGSKPSKRRKQPSTRPLVSRALSELAEKEEEEEAAASRDGDSGSVKAEESSSVDEGGSDDGGDSSDDESRALAELSVARSNASSLALHLGEALRSSRKKRAELEHELQDSIQVRALSTPDARGIRYSCHPCAIRSLDSPARFSPTHPTHALRAAL